MLLIAIKTLEIFISEYFPGGGNAFIQVCILLCDSLVPMLLELVKDMPNIFFYHHSMLNYLWIAIDSTTLATLACSVTQEGAHPHI